MTIELLYFFNVQATYMYTDLLYHDRFTSSVYNPNAESNEGR
jgi:hypothetical protein